MGSGYALADETSGGLAEIIVTAEKRSENIQDTPITVVAVSAQQIQDAGVTNIRNLTILTPGLTVTSEGNENITTARIRGIGTVGDNPGLESSVGVNIDGVYRPRNGVAFGDLGELEQIEVLYGPQGTLFGKNNDAGVINITTKRPSNTFGAMAEVTGGNFNDREFRGSITGPLGGIAAGRLYVGFQQNQGFLQLNDGIGPGTQNNTNDRHAFTTRGQLSLTPSDQVDVLFIADYSKRQESCCGAVQEYPGPFEGLVNAFASNPLLGGKTGAIGISPGAAGLTGATRLPNSYLAFANQPVGQNVRDFGLSGEVNWNLGFGKLTSITAWRDNTEAGGDDVDYSGIDLLQTPDDGNANSTDFKQFSEELRLGGKSGPLDWLVGFFYNDENLDTRTKILAGDQFETYISAVGAANLGQFNPLFISQLDGQAPGATFAGAGYEDRYHQNSKSYALFTNETYNVTNGLDITLGARATKEKKTAVGDYSNTDGGVGTNGCSKLLPPNSPGLYALPTLYGQAGANAQAFLLGYGCFTGFNPFFNGSGFDQSNDEGNVSGTFKVSYRFNDQFMTYVSVANGYKAGGFNLSRTTYDATTITPAALAGPLGPYAPLGIIPNLDTAFPRETVKSAEIGFKSTLLNRTLRFNGSVFYQHYTDFQLNTFTGIQFVVNSLPRVVSKGADFNFAWAPVSGLSLNGGVTYAFTNIDDFGSSIAQGDFCDVTNANCPHRDNNRLSFAPLWSGVAAAVYTIPFNSQFGMRASLEEKYNSSYNTGSDLDPRKVQGAFGLLNGRIGIGAPDDAWAVEVWGANLANKYYYAVAFDAPFQFNTIDSFLGAPRTFGITGRMRFK
jgi:outer membrane receptor protein involved in Fe transport